MPGICLRLFYLLHEEYDARDVLVSLLLQGEECLRGADEDLGLAVLDVVFKAHVTNDGLYAVVGRAMETGPRVLGDHLVSGNIIIIIHV